MAATRCTVRLAAASLAEAFDLVLEQAVEALMDWRYAETLHAEGDTDLQAVDRAEARYEGLTRAVGALLYEGHAHARDVIESRCAGVIVEAE